MWHWGWRCAWHAESLRIISLSRPVHCKCGRAGATSPLPIRRGGGVLGMVSRRIAWAAWIDDVHVWHLFAAAEAGASHQATCGRPVGLHLSDGRLRDGHLIPRRPGGRSAVSSLELRREHLTASQRAPRGRKERLSGREWRPGGAIELLGHLSIHHARRLLEARHAAIKRPLARLGTLNLRIESEVACVRLDSGCGQQPLATGLRPAAAAK